MMLVRDPATLIADIDSRLEMLSRMGPSADAHKFTTARIDELLDERNQCQPVAYRATVPALGWMATQPKPGADW